MNIGGCGACETCHKTVKARSFDDDFTTDEYSIRRWCEGFAKCEKVTAKHSQSHQEH